MQISNQYYACLRSPIALGPLPDLEESILDRYELGGQSRAELKATHTSYQLFWDLSIIYDIHLSYLLDDECPLTSR
jgi:hypothetical protein